MRDALKSTSYWATVFSIIILKWHSPRLEDAHILLASVAACYFIGRGIAHFPKLPIKSYKSSEFTILMLSIAFISKQVYLCDMKSIFSLSILIGSYNISQGLSDYYKSKVQMVLNR